MVSVIPTYQTSAMTKERERNEEKRDGASAFSKTDPPALSKTDPGILTYPADSRDDDDESSRCERPGRDHARSVAGGSGRMRE